MLLFLNEIESKKIGNIVRKRALYQCDNCKKKVERTYEKKGNIIQNGCSNCKTIKLKPIKEYISGLKVIKDLGLNKEKKPKREAVFLCFCGNEFKATINSVKTLQKKSCGCLKGNPTYFTHLKSKHPLYRKWSGMITRTTNKKEDRYKNYGGRGISVCDEWKNNFIAFYDWAMENGYKKGLSIDRINNDGNYEPSNCQWLTMKENSIKDRTSEYVKKYKSKEICEIYIKEHVTLRFLAKKYGTYKSVISTILKENNIEIKNRRMKKCF